MVAASMQPVFERMALKKKSISNIPFSCLVIVLDALKLQIPPIMGNTDTKLIERASLISLVPMLKTI